MAKAIAATDSEVRRKSLIGRVSERGLAVSVTQGLVATSPFTSVRVT